jgi:HTH-type transcriptional regulator / antitoxin HigA
MEIKPIRNDQDHLAALATIERLWGATPGTAEGDALDVLVTLADAYEEKRWPDTDVDPIELLKIVMEDTDRTQADLAVLIGSRSRASEILNRKRALTVEMIWKISREWSVPADMLIKPYSLESAA